MSDIHFMGLFMGSIIPKLRNRVTHYDATNRVTNLKTNLLTH